MTLFERIIAREIPATILHEDERCIAIADINPQAPVHFLVIPKKPLVRLAAVLPEDEALLGHLLLVAAATARAQGVEESGYRIVVNNGAHAGETVPHLHVHVLGGRPLAWPPG